MTDPSVGQSGVEQDAESAPLRATLAISFDYTRSLGVILSEFMTGLAAKRLLGARASDGRVHAPPFEFDPVTGAPPAELIEVGPYGTVVTWSWMPRPIEGQPLQHPFGWALIRLDGADTSMLHAVDAGAPEAMRTGMRVRPRWADESGKGVVDIACFEPVPTGEPVPAARATAAADPVSMITTPIQLSYDHTVSAGESSYLRAAAEGRLIGQRCPVCAKVYLPPRGACPVDGVPTVTEVELPDTGIVTTFCVVNVPFHGQRVPSPYVAASVLIDGADIAFQHLILGCSPDDVRMGMRVKAVWKPRAEWAISAQNIDHFEPTGEPDAPYECYAHHL